MSKVGPTSQLKKIPLSKNANNSSLANLFAPLTLGSSAASIGTTGSKSSSDPRPPIFQGQAPQKSAPGNLAIAAQTLTKSTALPASKAAAPLPHWESFDSPPQSQELGNLSVYDEDASSEEEGVPNPYEVAGRKIATIFGRPGSNLSTHSSVHIPVTSTEGPQPAALRTYARSAAALLASARGVTASSASASGEPGLEDNASIDDEETEEETGGLNDMFADLKFDLRDQAEISSNRDYPKPNPLFPIQVPNEIAYIVKRLVNNAVEEAAFKNMPIERHLWNILRTSLVALIPFVGTALNPIITKIEKYIKDNVDQKGSLKDKIKFLFLKINYVIPPILRTLDPDNETLISLNSMIHILTTNLNIYYHQYNRLPKNAAIRKMAKTEIGSAIYRDVEILKKELLYVLFINNNQEWPIHRLIIEMSLPFLKYKNEGDTGLRGIAEAAAAGLVSTTSLIGQGGGSKTRRKYKPKKQKTHSKQKRKYTYHSK